MVRKFVLLALLAAPLAVAGCSTSDDDDSGDVPTNCNESDTVSTTCGDSATGYQCDIGTTPEDDDPSRICSTPTPGATSDDYCCYNSGFDTSAGSCVPDDGVSDTCEVGSYGFTCAAGDTNPATQDSSLDSCSVPTGTATTDLYCCTYGGSGGGGGGGGGSYPTNCNVDTTLTCATGSTGYACDIGTDPESDDDTRICSTPTPGATEDDYCCADSGFSTSGGTCTPDDGVTDTCADGTYGFTCAAGDDDPTKQDSALDQCSQPDTSTDSDLYCCTYQ